MFPDVLFGRFGEEPIRDLMPAESITHMQQPNSVIDQLSPKVNLRPPAFFALEALMQIGQNKYAFSGSGAWNDRHSIFRHSLTGFGISRMARYNRLKLRVLSLSRLSMVDGSGQAKLRKGSISLQRGRLVIFEKVVEAWPTWRDVRRVEELLNTGSRPRLGSASLARSQQG